MNAIASFQQLLRRLALLGYCAVLPVVFAQSAPTKEEKSAASVPKVEEETIVLNPFVVKSDGDKGYRATNSISGTRLNTPIKDIPMPIEVITEEFLKDTGANDLREGLRYSAGIQLQSQNDYGTPGGVYQGPGGVNNPEGATANKSQSSFKIRGFVTESVLRDGYLRQHATDSINIGRVEVVRGPAALLYGTGNFGGLVNYLPKMPEKNRRTAVGFGLGTYGYTRATLDTTGPLAEKGDFNYRLTAAWESNEDYTDFKKGSHYFVSPVLTFKPTKTTDVVIDYEYGDANDEGIGFQRVRSSVGPGPNNDQNEHAAFYTLPGTSAREFRWSGSDPHIDTTASNLRLQVTQRFGENLNLLVGYNQSAAEFSKLDVIGNLQGWTDQFPNSSTAFAIVPFIPADPINGDSSGGLGSTTGSNATLAYRWTGEETQNDRQQTRAELNYNFKLFSGHKNKWLRMENMLMLGFSEQRYDNNIVTSQSAWNQANNFFWVTNYYNPGNKTPLKFGGQQANGTPELPFLKNRGTDTTSWNQGAYGILQSRLLDDRMLIVAGARRDRSETLVDTVTFLGSGAPTSTRSATQKQSTTQFGASFKLTREVSLYALNSEGLEPNFTGRRDINGVPLPSTLAKSKEVGLKIDLFNGKLTGTVSAFNIKRTNSPIFYWWAPTSNRSRFDPNRNIVYQVNEFRPSSLGGPSWTNGAGQASLSQWNAGLAAGTVYQVAGSNNWYVNASSATGAAFLDSVFNFTKANGFSWPGWLYNTDANTNNAWDNRASGPDGNEYVLGSDTSKGWDTQLMFTPNKNLQLVFTYSNTKRVVESAGQFAQYAYPQDRWAVWFFPNTDWGLTRDSLANAYGNASDTSTWTGTRWGQGLPMDDTPEHAASFWAKYAFDSGRLNGLSIGLGSSYESPRLYLSALTHGGGQQITDRNGEPVMLRTKAKYNVDLMLRYTFRLSERDASLQLNVTNLLDDQKLYGFIYNAPRQARLQFDYAY